MAQVHKISDISLLAPQRGCILFSKAAENQRGPIFKMYPAASHKGGQSVEAIVVEFSPGSISRLFPIQYSDFSY
jgi:hypothetical protein